MLQIKRVHKLFKRTNVVVSLPLLASLILAVSPMSTMAADSLPVVIAVAGPMVGTSFSIGVQYRVGVTAAINTLTQNGMLLGRQVNISSHDDSCHPKIAESLAKQIVQNPPAVVIGHSCSFATLAAAPIYAESNVLEITPASTNPKVTEMGITSIFRMIGRDDVQGKVAAEYLVKHYRDKKMGVVYFPGAYAKDLSLIALNELKKLGVEPAKTIIASKAAASYTDVIVELLSENIDVIYIVGGGLDIAVFIRQSRQMNATFKVVSSDTLVSKIFIETAGDAADGSVFTFPPEAAKLETSLSAQNAIKALGQEPVGYTLLAYAATQAWILGVERAQAFDTDLVADALKRAPLDTILGTISFDSKGDIVTTYPPFSWYIWKDGQRIMLE